MITTISGTMENGLIIHRGPSEIDGKDIVMILTGLVKNSKNDKTGGGMLQTFILLVDVDPVTAQREGLDVSVCGSCILRPTNKLIRLVKFLIRRGCYVKVFQAPLSVWKCFTRGGYDHIDDIGRNTLTDLVNGRMIRLGSYGDPLAISYQVLIKFLVKAGFPLTTGYTHQWRRKGASIYNSLVMASCDRVADKSKAHALGFHTATIGDNEVKTCPAQLSKNTVTCSTCKFCDGTSGDISFINH
jgi:hypothetical protein